MEPPHRLRSQPRIWRVQQSIKLTRWDHPLEGPAQTLVVSGCQTKFACGATTRLQSFCGRRDNGLAHERTALTHRAQHTLTNCPGPLGMRV